MGRLVYRLELSNRVNSWPLKSFSSSNLTVIVRPSSICTMVSLIDFGSLFRLILVSLTWNQKWKDGISINRFLWSAQVRSRQIAVNKKSIIIL
jgi:hypothetical protein